LAQVIYFKFLFSDNAVSMISLTIFVALVASASGRSDADLNGPGAIGKVVKMIEEMKTQVEKEGEEDKESYDKYACWCTTNDQEKTAAIENAEKMIDDLTSAIEGYAALKAKLMTEIEALEGDIAAANTALETAAAEREKEKGEFEAEAGDMKDALAALKEAIAVLSKVQLMQKQEFGKASIELEKMLKKEPEDPVLLHNLGVVYTEQERFAEAEETFMSAFEAQKKLNKYNYATLFGLATVLTEQGGQGKLLQAEALFRDCLMKAIAEEEKGVFETYRTFTSLAENLGLQKRWKDATEAYEQAYELGYRMFGKDHERTVAQGAMMVRAKKLAKMQKWMRGGLWCATAAVPIFCAWMWRWSGAPSMSEIFLMSTGQSNASATNAAGAMMG